MANGRKWSARDKYRLRRARLVSAQPEADTQSALPELDPAEFAALEEKVTALLEENNQLRDVALRQKAEFDNFRRRTMKEKEQIREAVREDLLIKLLPVVDNFDRALEASATASDAASLRQGVEMVAGQLYRILEADGLSRIEALNKLFNPEEHEALAVDERSDIPENHVSTVMLPGYRFRDKVVRAAMVKVARAPQTEPDTSESAEVETAKSEHNASGPEA